MARRTLKLKKTSDMQHIDTKEKQPAKIKAKQTKKTKPVTLQQHSQNLLKILETNHPDLFPTDGTPPKPWKIKIHKDITIRYEVTQKISKMALSQWRRHHHESYVATLIKDTPRYNLDGKMDGIIKESWSDTWKKMQRKRIANFSETKKVVHKK